MMNDTPLLIIGDSNLGQGDCDCACSTTPFQTTLRFTPASHFQAVPDVYQTRLTEEYWLMFSPYAPAGPSVVNNAGRQRYQQFVQKPQPLAQTIDYSFAEQNLILPVGVHVQPAPAAIDQLVVWLHVTNACNLDCPYCYVRKSSARMTEAVGKAAMEKIVQTAKREGLKKIKLKYAGGEALLHFKLITVLHDYVHQLVADEDIVIEEVVLSNGVSIKPIMADWLAATGATLMISVDGVGQAHDLQRPMTNGKATFAAIEKNIDNILRSRNVLPHISVTITGLNAAHVAETIEWILTKDLPFTLNFFRESDASRSFDSMRIEEDAIIQGLRDAYRRIERFLPSRPLLNGLLDKMITQAHTHTCGVGQNYLVITHQGHLSQCQMHLDEPVAQNLEADRLLPIISSGPIKNLSVDEKKGCQKCAFRYRCAGGCPLETYRATRRWDVQSPHCNIYKTLYPEALRVEGLRLLKANGFL